MKADLLESDVTQGSLRCDLPEGVIRAEVTEIPLQDLMG